ncbi:uncharacterized protein LOC120115513 [Hibiscus syriacus]|uniref:uncharacterized protein LOC120115513 n=1 Tax=Hibiscus syriacus TaxID=106335 RepID=UPI00192066ED|nr:uncharacterized protein LOC120115513 [Hibiscus syriacus]
MVTSPDMIEFQEVTHDLQLQDHPFFGPTYSWSNKQNDNFLARKLVRVLINPLWSESFPHSFVEFLAPGSSDHCMALVSLHKEVQTNRPKPFKFFNCWAFHQNFLNIVSQSWSMPIQGNPMKKIFLKLKRLKVSLQNLNKGFFRDISTQVRQKREEIEKQQVLTLRGVEPIDKELELQSDLKSLEEAEAMLLKQKAKFHLLKEGDRCSYDPNVKECSTSLLKDLLLPIPFPEDYDGLTKEVTLEEIKEAIFSQGNDKAPGPDAFNATTIALVPKILNPNKVSDFRPISCCSVIYKAITKVIVKRMTHLLPRIISSNQSAFVKGMSIIDNTLLAQEIVKGYGRKTISPMCALKIDFQKDFDSIHWGFIPSILKALKIPNIFIEWIVACYSAVNYSIAFNGSLIGVFKGAKGLRQGDPLSPILFVMVMNFLSKLLNNAAAKGIFNFHPKCKKICLT